MGLAGIGAPVAVLGIWLSAGRLGPPPPAPPFVWRVSAPLLAPAERPDDPCCSVKDPSVVYADGRWHVFCTIRSEKRTHQIEYLTFEDWEHTAEAKRTILTMHGGYFCAPEVFFFEPQGKWYLICQASDPSWTPEYQAAYSTTTDIADPGSWSPLKPLGHRPVGDNSGLDFWVICDGDRAYLLFTTLDGHMWREDTSLAAFPTGWSEPALAIEGDIFEAGHTYRLPGQERYLTLVEAQNGSGWRYYKAYTASSLAGVWQPLAADRDNAFASMANTTPTGERWADSISHGELLRAGIDQTLTVDPTHLRFVFQGVTEVARAGKPYGEIPWRLGLLEPAE
jgi:hypothetical protein